MELTISLHHTFNISRGTTQGGYVSSVAIVTVGQRNSEWLRRSQVKGVCWMYLSLVLCWVHWLVLIRRWGMLLGLLQDVHHPAEGLCGGERQVLAAQPVLQAHATGVVQRALCELDHHQCPLEVQPVLQGGLALARSGPGHRPGAAAAQRLKQVLPRSPEEALEAGPRLGHPDSFGGINGEQQARQLLQPL